MDLNDLLRKKDIDPERVLVFRHRPFEPELNRKLPWLAVEKPEVFKAYQQTQSETVEKALSAASHVVSCIGREAGKALFVGIYSVDGSRSISRDEYWKIPAYVEMKKFGMEGFSPAHQRESRLWFDMTLLDVYSDWKGKLVVSWPPPERSWWRRAHRNEFSIAAILSESALVSPMPLWDTIILRWDEINSLPHSWRIALMQWRGVYYIRDESDGLAYIGSAYGADNMLGRWLNYASRGHGGNKFLRKRNPENFRFSILQLLAPDVNSEEVIRIENTWKDRLHTRWPQGLNDN